MAIDQMSSRDWDELSRLAAKAARHEEQQYSNQSNANMLKSVAAYAGRMA